MRHSFLAALILVAAASFAIRAEDPPKEPAPPGLETLEKRASYSLGYNLAQQIKSQGEAIDHDAILRGLKEGLGGTAPVMSEAAMRQAIMEYQKVLEQRELQKHAEKAKKNKEDGAAYLEKNKSAEGVKVTASGLQYKCVKQGNGQKPTAKDSVKVNYEGTLIDGTVFDSSYRRGEPIVFPLGGVIPGWTEGLQLMDVGSTYLLYIPANLAYGDSPPPGVIGPGSVLIFKIELLEINPKQDPHRR